MPLYRTSLTVPWGFDTVTWRMPLSMTTLPKVHAVNRWDHEFSLLSYDAPFLWIYIQTSKFEEKHWCCNMMFTNFQNLTAPTYQRRKSLTCLSRTCNRTLLEDSSQRLIFRLPLPLAPPSMLACRRPCDSIELPNSCEFWLSQHWSTLLNILCANYAIYVCVCVHTDTQTYSLIRYIAWSEKEANDLLLFLFSYFPFPFLRSSFEVFSSLSDKTHPTVRWLEHSLTRTVIFSWAQTVSSPFRVSFPCLLDLIALEYVGDKAHDQHDIQLIVSEKSLIGFHS